MVRNGEGRLCVELEGALGDEELRHVLSAIEEWLRAERVSGTRVKLDEREHHLFAA